MNYSTLSLYPQHSFKSSQKYTPKPVRKNTEVCYGYFAGFYYQELLDKFRNLRNQGIEPETIWSFNDERKRTFILFKFQIPTDSQGSVLTVIYERKEIK